MPRRRVPKRELDDPSGPSMTDRSVVDRTTHVPVTSHGSIEGMAVHGDRSFEDVKAVINPKQEILENRLLGGGKAVLNNRTKNRSRWNFRSTELPTDRLGFKQQQFSDMKRELPKSYSNGSFLLVSHF